MLNLTIFKFFLKKIYIENYTPQPIRQQKKFLPTSWEKKVEGFTKPTPKLRLDTKGKTQLKYGWPFYEHHIALE